MTPNDYQRRALATALPAALDASYLTLGLCGEAGEVAELQKKAIRDGEKPDHADRLHRELGDVLWYVAVLAHVSGFTLEDVMAANLAKLSTRQATGTLGGSGDYRGEAAALGGTGTGPAPAPATVEPYPSGAWEYDYRLGSYVFTGPPDEALREMTARIRYLEAAVSEARAEAAQWAAELDGDRAAVVAYLRESASVADEFGAVADALTAEADAIERGEHRAGGAR